MKLSTAVAWTPCLVLAGTFFAVQIFNATVHDWLCGPPGEICYPKSMQVVFVRGCIILALIAFLAATVLVVMKKLNRTGYVGYALSALVIFSIIALLIIALKYRGI